MNILKTLGQQKSFLVKWCNEFEQAIMPVLGLIENPNAISFEDDICLLVKMMIRKSKKVSDIQL